MEPLSAEQRTAIREAWEARAQAELETGAAFTLVASRLDEVRAPAAIVERLLGFAGDERRHHDRCRSIANRYREGGLAGAPTIPPVTEPSYPGAPPELRALLHAVNLCAISETIAGAFLELALLATTVSDVRDVLREQLADEVQHARMGWTLLAQASAPTRAQLAPWLAPLLAGNLRMWLDRNAGRNTRSDLASHGCPPSADVAQSVLAAVSDLVLPGFEHVGLDATGARAWFARHFRDR